MRDRRNHRAPSHHLIQPAHRVSSSHRLMASWSLAHVTNSQGVFVPRIDHLPTQAMAGTTGHYAPVDRPRNQQPGGIDFSWLVWLNKVWPGCAERM